ncbi:MAG: DUF5615 family PIN-like protein [Candidatus Riflebacteria bacterium]|nr:DUF5615 family PIN-like protein [Candidatus Riflebacteria bacterium]
MKLLFDQNLSHRLASQLRGLYPGSSHVREVGLEAADDESVWRYAAAGGFTIVSKDDDFHQRSFLRGAPPKVIWVRLGNCTTQDVAALLRAQHSALLRFEVDPEAAFLALGRDALGPGVG